MQKAKEIIKFFEGTSLTAYQDSGGIWTIGTGSTKNVTHGMVITEKEADKRLEEDLKDAQIRVFFSTGTSSNKVHLDPDEMDCLISLAFNLRSFERLARHLRKDKELFKKKMLFYCRDIQGNYLKGLTIRRICERLLFESKEWLSIAKELQNLSLSEIIEREKQLFG